MNTIEAEDVLSTAATWRAAGEQVAVATVTETWGSSPRPAGSQMAVTKSGRMAGSVSGALAFVLAGFCFWWVWRRLPG